MRNIIRAHDSESYILIGSCQNAIVAHEVALQFKKMGKAIDLLIIIDENWKASEKEDVQPSDSKYKKLIDALKQHSGRHLFKKITDRIKRILIRILYRT